MLPFKQLLINLFYPITTTTTATTTTITTTNSLTNIIIVNENYVILQIKYLYYISCSL